VPRVGEEASRANLALLLGACGKLKDGFIKTAPLEGGSSGGALARQLTFWGAGKVAEIRGHQHHDVFMGPPRHASCNFLPKLSSHRSRQNPLTWRLFLRARSPSKKLTTLATSLLDAMKAPSALAALAGEGRAGGASAQSAPPPRSARTRADGKQLCGRPGTAVKLLWPAVIPALAGEHLAIEAPINAIRNRHWQSPGRYHTKLPNSPAEHTHTHTHPPTHTLRHTRARATGGCTRLML
jgi:hypothetical protein